MAFFRWFGKKAVTPEPAQSLTSDLGQADATVPIHRLPQHLAQPHRSPDAANRRTERLERRELLYGIVRECMTGAGLLSSTYKFKVLSLDSGGRQYLIMMDLPREYLADPAHFAEIEGSIARSAKERFDMLVSAVYWRVNDLVTAGQSQHPSVHAAATAHRQEAAGNALAVSAPHPYAALQQEEVLAFKRAVAEAASRAVPIPLGEQLKSGPRHPEPVPDFGDTEPVDVASPLGVSQYGGL
jgi:hypothetical protein